MTASRTKSRFDSRPDLPIAIVVGAGGMGMSIAQRLGQSHRLMLVSLGASELAHGHDRLHEAGVITATAACDITDPGSVHDLADRLAPLGPVQALCHVVGLSPSMASGPAILAVNLVGAARIEQAIGPLVAPGGAGVFISSMAAQFIDPVPDLLALLDDPLADELLARLPAVLGGPLTPAQAYPFSKLGLNRLVRRRAGAWGRRGTRINTVSPGLIDTPMGARESGSNTHRDAMRAHLPLLRDGTMPEIADAVEFLLSPRAAYITGVDLLVDGGMTAAIRSGPAKA